MPRFGHWSYHAAWRLTGAGVLALAIALLVMTQVMFPEFARGGAIVGGALAVLGGSLLVFASLRDYRGASVRRNR